MESSWEARGFTKLFMLMRSDRLLNVETRIWQQQLNNGMKKERWCWNTFVYVFLSLSVFVCVCVCCFFHRTAPSTCCWDQKFFLFRYISKLKSCCCHKQKTIINHTGCCFGCWCWLLLVWLLIVVVVAHTVDLKPSGRSSEFLLLF